MQGAEDQTGPWDAVGRTRRPLLSDGSTANERITEYLAHASFAYELTGFTNVLDWIVEGVRGEWTFTPDGTGTMVRWIYEFKPRPGFSVLTRLLLAPLWRQAMIAAMARTIRVVGEATASA